MTTVVFDIGKTNLKLSAADGQGRLLETLSAPNLLSPGPSYATIDLPHAQAFLMDGLRQLGQRHRITDIIAATHGGLAFLVGQDGGVTPMPDYESTTPPAVMAAYAAVADDYPVRCSPIAGQGMHVARQLLWLGQDQPALLDQAQTLLMGPQFWAWWLSGVPAAEVSMLAALTHFWDVPACRYAPIVTRRGWDRLMPPLRRAWDSLGPMAPDLAARLGLSEPPRIRCGVHDSTANFYRYQVAGLSRFTLLSSGTWLVGLSNEAPVSAAEEHRGMSLNADVFGAPMIAALAMGGREYGLLKGEQDTPATPADIAQIIARGCFALPSFVDSDGFVADAAGRGRIHGSPPESNAGRRALAALYIALLADLGLDLLASKGQAVLDGPFTLDPLYSGLIAQLRGDQTVLLSDEAAGTSVGAALLAQREQRAAAPDIALLRAEPLSMDGLAAYRSEWRRLSLAAPPSTEEGSK
jgi:sugar (pentulose or hexulose) kinase